MSGRMTLEEFEHLAPAYVGSVRANHTSDTCSGGRDSMIVTRKSDGTVNAHCFRCGAWGLHLPSSYRRSVAEIRGGIGRCDEAASHRTVRGKPESGGAAGYRACPIVVRAWLAEAHITGEAETRGFEWFDKDNHLYIPVLKSDVLVGWARRSFNPKDYRPVMLVESSKFFAHYASTEAGTVVLCEDVLSAYRCFRDTMHDSIALMGTEIKDSIIQTVMEKGYHTAIVFLDGDNPTVRMKARKIAKRLPFLNTRIIEDGRDPKRHSPGELSCLLT